MSKTEGALKQEPTPNQSKLTRLLWVAAIAALIIYLIAKNLGVFGNSVVVALGFGAVILVHEFGHFIVAKVSDIHVEAFSIGFPPVFAGIQRMENGWRIRVLPDIFKNAQGQPEGLFNFTFGGTGKPSETEYRIGMIPFGGFVKMLGQEDVGTSKSTDDPRSYANKPVSTRMAVIAAGVVFNVISAVIIFMTAFLIGIELQPPIVGGVVPDSPAAKAGLKSGDEIIAINNKAKNLDFGDIAMAAALSNKNQAIAVKVRHQDGSVGDYKLVAEPLPGEAIKGFGIYPQQTLKIAKVSDADAMYKELGLQAGDKIVGVDGKKVENYGQLEEIIKNTFAPEVTIQAERTDKVSHKVTPVETKIPLGLSAHRNEVKSEYDLSQICSMVPRLQIMEVSGEEDVKIRGKVKSSDIGLATGGAANLRNGDVILAAGNVENPTYKELRDITTEHKDKELAIKVLRTEPNGVEKVLTVMVTPKENPANKKVMIGIAPSLDASHAVVAKTIKAEDGPEALAIPRGATVTSVNGTPVSNFYDIIRQVQLNAGKQITINYRTDEQKTGEVSLDTAGIKGLVTVESVFAKPMPFEELRKLYKANGPVEAVEMGYDKTIAFIAQTYVTLKRLVSGLVSPKDLMGPVGIVSFSYRIVSEQPLIYYVYFLGLISACIAVFNFLPLPPLDGGHIVLLTIEKIKGSALSERTIGIVAYAGWVLIGTFFLYVTFNDVVRSFFGRYQ